MATSNTAKSTSPGSEINQILCCEFSDLFFYFRIRWFCCWRCSQEASCTHSILTAKGRQRQGHPSSAVAVVMCCKHYSSFLLTCSWVGLDRPTSLQETHLKSTQTHHATQTPRSIWAIELKLSNSQKNWVSNPLFLWKPGCWHIGSKGNSASTFSHFDLNNDSVAESLSIGDCCHLWTDSETIPYLWLMTKAAAFHHRCANTPVFTSSSKFEYLSIFLTLASWNSYFPIFLGWSAFDSSGVMNMIMLESQRLGIYHPSSFYSPIDTAASSGSSSTWVSKCSCWPSSTGWLNSTHWSYWIFHRWAHALAWCCICYIYRKHSDS